MNKQFGKLKRVGTAGLAALLLCCTLPVGCGRYEETGQLPEQTEKLPENTESSESAVSSGETEQTAETVPEDKTESFRYNPDLIYNTTQGIVTEEQAREQGRDILTLQVASADNFITNSVAGFNRQSDSYYILIQESGYGESLKTCRERTLVELIAGRGPDIFVGDTFPTINESVLQKGILMDLAPLLDSMEITDEKYFPAVRALTEGEHVYGFCTSVIPDAYWILESVLGDREQPDIETLVDKLCSYPDQKAVWRQYAPHYLILEYLLSGSENMWGMIDWETGRCDFSGDLFAKILEIAKRYGDPEGNGQTAITGWYEPGHDIREDVESEGKVILNFPFDDGWYPYCRTSYALMVNANTKYPKGAYEFIQYLLGEEGQTYAAGGQSGLPASRAMADSYKEWELKTNQEGLSHHFATKEGLPVEIFLTEEMADEIKDYAEQARYLPLKTKEIMSIINEEANMFFSGDKTLDAVCDIIQNRVQVYLDENM